MNAAHTASNRTSEGSHVFATGILLIAVFVIAAASVAGADVTYTYTGNPFTTFFHGATCPPICNVTGWFTVPQLLAPNLSDVAITPDAMSESSAGITLTLGTAAAYNLVVSTDGSGNLVGWTFYMLGGANSGRLLAQNRPGFVYDTFHYTDSNGNVGPLLAEVLNDPGTWSVTTPEPATLGLLLSATGLLRIRKSWIHHEVRN